MVEQQEFTTYLLRKLSFYKFACVIAFLITIGFASGTAYVLTTTAEYKGKCELVRTTCEDTIKVMSSELTKCKASLMDCFTFEQADQRL